MTCRYIVGQLLRFPINFRSHPHAHNITLRQNQCKLHRHPEFIFSLKREISSFIQIIFMFISWIIIV